MSGFASGFALDSERQLLDPLSEALDVRDYAKARKLASAKPALALGPIVLALRAFACVRLEKHDEAVADLRAVLFPGQWRGDARENLARLFDDPIILSTAAVAARNLPASHAYLPPPAPPNTDVMSAGFSALLACAASLPLPVPPAVTELHITHLLRSLSDPRQARPPLFQAISKASASLYKATGLSQHLFAAGTSSLLAHLAAPEAGSMLPRLACAQLKKALEAKPLPAGGDWEAYLLALGEVGDGGEVVRVLREEVRVGGGGASGIQDEESVRGADGGVVLMSGRDRIALLLRALSDGGDFEGARELMVAELGKEGNEDAWNLWAGLHGAILRGPNPTETLQQVVDLADAAIQREKKAKLRGPRLAKLRVACHAYEATRAPQALKALLDQVTAYRSSFASLLCCAPDLEPSIMVLREALKDDEGAGGDSFGGALRLERSQARYREGQGAEEHRRNVRKYVTAWQILDGVFGEPLNEGEMMEQ
jgi:hypothetical protein